FMESALLVPLVAVYLTYRQVQGTAVWIHAPATSLVLLACAGIVTGLPLLWFALAAQRTTLATLGFVQYLSPTLTLAIGVLVYHEPFSTYHMISFGFIWGALLIYSLSGTKLLQGVNRLVWKESSRQVN
ncbi:MAG TPA: EamA family transporter, partial [Bacillota bacterium]|nr:EamA family transporter [Bacillota bacterium]